MNELPIINEENFIEGNIIIIQPLDKRLLDRCLDKMKINLAFINEISSYDKDSIIIWPILREYAYHKIEWSEKSCVTFYLIDLNQMAKELGVK